MASLRPLVIDERAISEAARVVGYAKDRPHHPGLDPTPGDNPNFVAHLDTYRVVFTFDRYEGRLYRHVSVSIPEDGKYPNPIAVFHIAELFGFTGYKTLRAHTPAQDWMVDLNEGEQSVHVIQEVRP